MKPFTKEETLALRQLRKAIGENIGKARREKGMEIEMLSGLTGISLKRLICFEAGKREIRLDALIRIASVLKVQPEMLLSETTR